MSNEQVQPATSAAPRQSRLIVQNGQARPMAGGITGRVWAIADELSEALGAPVPRKDVMAKGKAEGINESTITTQYGRWRKFHGLTRATLDEAEKEAAKAAKAAEKAAEKEAEKAAKAAEKEAAKAAKAAEREAAKVAKAAEREAAKAAKAAEKEAAKAAAAAPDVTKEPVA